MESVSFYSANSKFAIELFNKLVSNNESNIFISPSSISIALSIVYAAADANTRNEMSKALHYEEIEDESLFKNFRSFLDEFKKSSQTTLITATSFLVHESLQLNQHYEQLVKEVFDVNLQQVDFRSKSEQITASVNEWVKDQTKGKIEKLLEDSLDPETAALIINATYFRGLWLNPFEKEITRPGEFYNKGKNVAPVQMMHQDDRFRVVFDTGCNSSAIELLYKDEIHSMLIVLPNERDGLSELETNFSPQLYDKIDSELQPMRVMLNLPKFKLDFFKSLNDTLKMMGIKDMFDKNSANLQKMSPGGQLYVSEVFHKAVLEVDEIGSEAAAATAIKMMLMCLPPSFNIDHPFLFIIRNIKSKAIFFMGKVWEL